MELWRFVLLLLLSKWLNNFSIHFQHRFIQVFIQQVMAIVTNAEDGSVTSDDTTLLYRLLSVLKTILQQSLKLRRHIHDFYTEEFR